MKFKNLMGIFGSLFALWGFLWIVLMPNYAYSFTQYTTLKDETVTAIVRSLDMPYAFALIVIGVLFAIVGLFIPENIVISSED